MMLHGGPKKTFAAAHFDFQNPPLAANAVAKIKKGEDGCGQRGIDQKLIKSFALQTGAPGVTTITPYNIPGSTQLRHVTERVKIVEFIEDEPHERSNIRSRLRTVCEDFYRKVDPGLFGEAATLDQIIRALDDAPADHPFKGALENLKDINTYSRVERYAKIDCDPYGDTNPDELKGFCEIVLDLTWGM